MFHGIVKSAKGYWFRLITSAALLNGETVVEEFNPGPYKPAFLQHFFPGKYRVEVRKINKKVFNFTKSAFPITGALFSSEVIRWSTASDQFMVRIKGNQGWLSSFKDIGLIIQNSKKMSKRLAEIVRTTSMWLYDPSGSIKVEVITNYVHKADVDGISAISRSLAARAVRSNKEAFRSWRAKQIWKIMTGQTVVVEFRMLTSEGLIKGNALVLPKRMMNGYDVRTFPPNIKTEIKTNGWQWLTIEPSYGAIPVKSDDLSHSIYHSVSGLYDNNTLLASLNGMLETFFDDLQEGKKSEWMTRLAEVNVLHEDEEEEFSSGKGLVSIIQERIAALSRVGVDLTASQTLMFLSVNGLRKMLLGDKYSHPRYTGQVWKDKSRHWFPVPWAYAAHIMTKEALEIFGFDMPEGDYGFYHEATHCFVIPGEHFQRHYSDHGGWDLDDSVKVHIRLIDNQMIAFLLRNPNDFGEWSIIPVLEAGPVYHTYTDQPPIIDYYELFHTVPQFSWAKEDLDIGELPGSKNLVVDNVFSLKDEARVRLASTLFPAGTGGTVIPKIIHNALVGNHIQEQFASNEDIIDALQQGMATSEDIEVIQKYIGHIFQLIKQKTGGKIDAFWAETRLFEELMDLYNLEVDDISNSPWVTLHRERESMVRASIDEMTEWLNNNITKPDILDKICWTPEEMMDAPIRLAKIEAARKASSNWVQEFVKLLKESDAEHGKDVTNRKILLLANQAFAAKAQYPKANHDRWLYSFSAKSVEQPIDWFIRALKAQQPS